MSQRLIVRVGNANAIELRNSVNPATGAEEPIWVTVPGERVTTIQLEDGLNFMQQMAQVIRFLQEMMAPGSKPWWFECDDETLRSALCDHYGVNKALTRPVQWGDGSTTTPSQETAPKTKTKHPGTNENSDQTPEGGQQP